MLRTQISLLFALLLVWAAGRTAALPPEATSSAGPAGLAAKWLDSLSPDLRKKAVFTLDDAERKDWSNLPASAHARKGVSIGEMDDAGRKAANDLLRASLSSQGYHKAAAVIHREDILIQSAAPDRLDRARQSFGTGRYYVNVFGEPAPGKPWGWQFDGHHLALNFTILNGEVIGTPALWGAQPDEIETGSEAGWRVFAAERAKGLALMHALTTQQRAKAVLSETLPKGGIFTGPQRDKALQTIEGLPASAMTKEQQALLWSLIGEYVDNQAAAAAQAHRRKIERDGFAKVHFAWMGPADDKRSFYFRVHGPSLLIEYDNTGAGREERDSNHIHSVYRDPSNDYGEDLLKKHYMASPHGK
jgi:hypothetical protein